MSRALADVYGRILAVRPPVPATVNKAGANYKSEVAHPVYAPRRAYDEWLTICEGIVSLGGDAVFDFEPEDEPFLDKGDLTVDAEGKVRPQGSSEVLGDLSHVLTGRVFAANGPWVVIEGRAMRAVLPHMLPHRITENAYYRRLLGAMAEQGGYSLDVRDNPHRWEGMADVAPVVRGDGAGETRVVLTYTVKGHYDAGVGEKTMRSSLEGVTFAADFAGVPERERIYAELVYPHFHGDTVHFGGRPPGKDGILVHYPGGLYGEDATKVKEALGASAILLMERGDAVEAYTGNSRQVMDGLLVPDGASEAFVKAVKELGLAVVRVPLFELFGKAGGGPACATLYLPKNLVLPSQSPLLYSARRAEARARRERIAERLTVDPGFFEGRARG